MNTIAGGKSEYYMKGLGCLPFACLFLFFISIMGCYTQRKAVDQVHKAIDKYPDTTASIFRDKWKCITTASDTLFKTIIKEGRTDTTYRTDTLTLEAECDSAGQVIKKQIEYRYLDKLRVDTAFITTTITNKIEDRSYQTKVDAALKEAAKQSSKKDFWFYWAIIATILLLLSWIYFLVKNKLK